MLTFLLCCFWFLYRPPLLFTRSSCFLKTSCRWKSWMTFIPAGDILGHPMSWFVESWEWWVRREALTELDADWDIAHNGCLCRRSLLITTTRLSLLPGDWRKQCVKEMDSWWQNYSKAWLYLLSHWACDICHSSNPVGNPQNTYILQLLHNKIYFADVPPYSFNL